MRLRFNSPRPTVEADRTLKSGSLFPPFVFSSLRSSPSPLLDYLQPPFFDISNMFTKTLLLAAIASTALAAPTADGGLGGGYGGGALAVISSSFSLELTLSSFSSQATAARASSAARDSAVATAEVRFVASLLLLLHALISRSLASQATAPTSEAVRSLSFSSCLCLS
jgi:hypothetical protein